MPTIWTVVIMGNVLVMYDRWRHTEQGAATIARWHDKLAAQRERVKNCEGCSRRRDALHRAINRVHWDAERIVEGEDVPTVPEP